MSTQPKSAPTYVWEPTTDFLASKYGLPRASIVRFDVNTSPLPPDLREMELKLQELTREGAAAVQSQDYERAAQIKEQSDKIQATREELASLKHEQAVVAES